MDVARSMGLSVPDDLSVIGFDNVPESALVNLSLTTIMQPLQRMGAEALRLLIDIIAGVERDTHIRLPTELVIRASCRPLPSSTPATPPPPTSSRPAAADRSGQRRISGGRRPGRPASAATRGRTGHDRCRCASRPARPVT